MNTEREDRLEKLERKVERLEEVERTIERIQRFADRAETRIESLMRKPQHVRGSAKSGAVVKDYNVKGPKS